MWSHHGPVSACGPKFDPLSNTIQFWCGKIWYCVNQMSNVFSISSAFISLSYRQHYSKIVVQILISTGEAIIVENITNVDRGLAVLHFSAWQNKTCEDAVHHSALRFLAGKCYWTQQCQWCRNRDQRAKKKKKLCFIYSADVLHTLCFCFLNDDYWNIFIQINKWIKSPINLLIYY